ncbi:nonstructural protein [Microviridae sp.]|nr:nonstructural protein [Microviridae sp.]
MKQLAFSVYDIKAKAFINPYFVPTEEVALRSFTDCVNATDHPFNKNPGDYTLTQIGEFDIISGVFTPEPLGPKTLINALQAQTMSKAEPLKKAVFPDEFSGSDDLEFVEIENSLGKDETLTNGEIK